MFGSIQLEKCCAGKYTKCFDILSSQEKKDFSFWCNHINFDAVCDSFEPRIKLLQFTWMSATWQRDNEKESENDSHTYQRNRTCDSWSFYTFT